jgi:hypothetical protein
MIIDLSDWNEYIADDVPPEMPIDVELELMNIYNTISIKSLPQDGIGPGVLRLADPKGSIGYRMFWRVKENRW